MNKDWASINIRFGSCFLPRCFSLTSFLEEFKHKQDGVVFSLVNKSHGNSKGDRKCLIEQNARDSIYSRSSEYNLVMVQKH